MACVNNKTQKLVCGFPKHLAALSSEEISLSCCECRIYIYIYIYIYKAYVHNLESARMFLRIDIKVGNGQLEKPATRFARFIKGNENDAVLKAIGKRLGSRRGLLG